MKIIVIITSISMLYSSEVFKGFINLGKYNLVYAEGQYEGGDMNGKWSFYSDSTKYQKISSGNYIKGDKTRPSRTGIPQDGRDGVWKHYYETKYSRNSMKNPLKAIQYWSNGRMNGEFTSYFKDGKIAVESTYKNGKQHGLRKEWYMNGFMYTNIFRETEYKEGTPIKDKIYNLDSNLYMTSSYNDSSRIDSIYEYKNKSLVIISEVRDKILHGKHKLFHLNGQIWQEGQMINGLPNGIWKEYSDKGILLSQVRFENGYGIIDENEKQVVRDIDGDIIYSYNYVNSKRDGESIELLYNVPNIKHDLELNKMSRHRRCNFIKYFKEYSKDYSIKYKVNANSSRDNMRWNNNGYANYIITLNKYQDNQYTINWTPFKGVYKSDSRNRRMPQNRIIGNGAYKENIRIGGWIWRDMVSNKIILKGYYDNSGTPVGVWEESDPRDENNLIITTYSDGGKVISVSKKTTTYSSK